MPPGGRKTDEFAWLERYNEAGFIEEICICRKETAGKSTPLSGRVVPTGLGHDVYGGGSGWNSVECRA